MNGYDDREAKLLLLPLAEEPLPPSGLDAATMVRAGRRRVRRRRLTTLAGAGALTAAALVAVPLAVSALSRPAPVTASLLAAPSTAAAAPRPESAPPAPTSCTAQRLPVPAGVREAVVLDGDPAGRFHVGIGYAAGRTWALRWDGGRLTVLSPPAKDVDSLVVNAAGVVAGSGGTAAWVYEDGAYRRLQEVPSGPDGGIQVTGINARGEVVGNQGITGKLKEGATVRFPWRIPVRWPAGEGSPRALPLPDGDLDVAAQGIADDGTVVGQLTRRDEVPARSADRAVSWTADGDLRELSPPRGAGSSTGAHAVTGDWVVGWSEAADTQAITRWNLRTGAVATVDDLAYVGGVNRHGWLAGFLRAADGYETPAFAADGKVVRLPSVAGALPGKEGPGAFTLSDDGRVLGGILVTGADERPLAVRWTCE
jgi:uncharacterized membrane protein